MSTVKIAPSLLAADFAELRAEIERVGSMDWLHLDIMDGHFVPNISFGIPVIASIRETTGVLFDCHVMSTNPDRYLAELAEAGADQVTMHIEALPDPVPASRRAREANLRFGLVINPITPFSAVAPFVELCDVVVVMSVEPGFGGQTFISEVVSKITEAREWVEARGFPTDIQIDGGITSENARQVADAGANVLVVGSSVFRAEEPSEAVEVIRRAAEGQ